MTRTTLFNQRAFSLIELLVVITIVAVLLAVVLPSLSASREVARDAMCKSNMRQMAVAATNYRNDFQVYLPSFQVQNNDPNCNASGDVRSAGRFGSSGQGLLYTAGYISFPLGLYSSSATTSRGPQLEAARRSTVSLCASGRYYGPPQAPMALAYIIHPGSADGMDTITRTQDGYDTSRAGTRIRDDGYDAQTAYIQSYSVNSRFSTAILVPGPTARTSYTAVKQIPNSVRESKLLLWAEYFQRDGLDHGNRISMTNTRGVSSELSMPRWAYFRTPHGQYNSGNWAALDGHVEVVRVPQLQAAWAAANVTLAAAELPFEF